MTPPAVAGPVVRIAHRSLDIGGSPAALDAISPALSRLDNGPRPAAASLSAVVDPDPLGSPFWRGRAEGWHHGDEGAAAVVQRSPAALERFSPAGGGRLEVRVSPEALDGGDFRARPATYAIASWLASGGADVGTLLVHAGAAAIGERAILFVGAGGRGKSTTSLACAQSGFSFMADDLCVVEPADVGQGRPAQVHAVYATAKLNPDSQMRLGAGDWPSLGTGEAGKAVVLVPESVPFTTTATLAAVVVVRPPDGADPVPGRTHRVLSAAQAVPPLVAAAAPCFSGVRHPGDSFRTAAALAASVPAYSLSLDWDLEAVVAVVTRILDHSSDRSPVPSP